MERAHKGSDLPQWYFSSRFEVPQKPQQYPTKFMIITAFNPLNQAMTAASNRTRNQILLADLKERFSWCYEINGYDPNPKRKLHKEYGYMVNCSNVEAACNIGLNYQQDAIYFVLHNNLYVTQCAVNKRKLVEVGEFSLYVD